MKKRPVWPKSKLLRHGPELPLEERIARYQHNIRAIRRSGCQVPSVMPDTLDKQAIAAWFAASAETSRRLRVLIRQLAALDPETTIPLAPVPPAKKEPKR